MLGPGIYDNIPSEEYHRWPHASASRLKVLDALTPLHLREQMDGDGQTPAMMVGEALHCLVLEPQRFDSVWGEAPDVDRRTKQGKAAWEAAQSSGLRMLSADDMARVRGMAKSIAESRACSGLLRMAPRREVSVVSKMHGSLVKARIDAFGDGLIVDIKTTSRGAGRADFERAIGSMGYALQAALYLNALAAHDIPVSNFVFIAVESQAPYAVKAYDLDNSVVDLYEQRLPRLLELYYDCVSSNRWPGWADTVENIGVPAYLMKQLTMEDGNG